MREWSVRKGSPPPVPASMRPSWSRSIDVVSRCRPPIPPLHPRIRNFIDGRPRLFLVEHGHAVPFGRRGDSALPCSFLRVQLVESASRIHAMKIEQIHFHLIPLAAAGATHPPAPPPH